VLHIPEVLRGVRVLAYLRPTFAFPVGGWLVMLTRTDPRVRRLLHAGYRVSFDKSSERALVEPVSVS
jgi:hypothetical protein